MSIGIFELVNGVLTKKKIAGKTLMDAQLNANSRNGVQNRIITGEINDIKDDISTINTHFTNLEKTVVVNEVFIGNTAAGTMVTTYSEAVLKNIANLPANATIDSASVTNLHGSAGTDVDGCGGAYNTITKELYFTPKISQIEVKADFVIYYH